MKTYQDQSDKLKKTTVDKLKARQAALQKSGDENAAGEIQTMIDNMEVQGNAKEKMITVMAKFYDRGTPLGNFKKGDKITFQYVKGTWTNDKEKDKMVNPDDVNHYYTVVCSKLKANVPTEQVVTLPKATQAIPFTYVFEQDTKNVFLSVTYGGGMRNPDGEVTYKVTIEKQ